MRSIPAARRVLVRLASDYDRGLVGDEKARTLGYLVSLVIHSLVKGRELELREAELALADRLAQIEDKLGIGG
jgi:hypothetical protein